MFQQSFTKNLRRRNQTRSRRKLSPRRTPGVELLESRRLLAVTVSGVDPSTIDEDSSNSMDYTLERPAGESAEYLTVKFELAGTATYIDDYRIRTSDVAHGPEEATASGPVFATATFEPGETEVDVRIEPESDALDEFDETVILTITPSDEFGLAAGAAVLRVVDPVFYAVDDANRLATVNVETGCVEFIGTIQVTSDMITDIAFTEDGTLFAISSERLYEVDYEGASAGEVPATDLGEHGIGEANALIDSRDGDFGSDTGDLFAVGADTLNLFRIDLEEVAGDVVINGVSNVFDIDAALDAILVTTNYVSSGDLDYAGGDIVLSALGDAEAFDSLIRIETPGSAGVISTPPVPAQDFGEDFLDINGLAIANSDLAFGFSGHILLSISTFSLNTSRELELTGRPYDVGIPDTGTGTILGNAIPGMVINTNDSGPGSLRDAILFSNSEPGIQTIDFDIPGSTPHLIAPLTALPVISEPVVIAGTSEPDYVSSPVIQLDGGDTIDFGLTVTSGGSTINGLSITGFADSGIFFFSAGTNVAEDNYIGINPAGLADGNVIGIKVAQSPDNEITSNVISGNLDRGVFINGVRARGNLVSGNSIGTSPSGSTAVANLGHGVSLWGPLNTVSGNLISGNGGSGVSTRFAHGGSNTIDSNLIGLNLAGTAALANDAGVRLRSPQNTVDGNTLSGNRHGVVIAGDDARLNIVTANMIGTNASGTAAIGNDVYGVAIIGAKFNAVGDQPPGKGNLISGNGLDGVLVTGSTATTNWVQSNQIGVNSSGGSAIPNGGDGVRIVQSASSNIVRLNQISGNARRGVAIDGSAVSGNRIAGNRIGTDAAGTSTLHNSNDVGVLLKAPGNEISSNVVSAIDAAITSYSGFATGNTIADNNIGGHAALATPNGIRLLGGSVGTSVTGNTIAGGQRGIVVAGAATGNDLSRNVIFGNSLIGIDLGDNGVTANDAGDPDAGPNRMQNTPEISAATVVGADLDVTYLVDTLPAANASYPLRIEFFASSDDQARVLLGTDSYSAANHAAGDKPITLSTVVSLLVPGDELTATATDADGNTSELSLGFTIT